MVTDLDSVLLGSRPWLFPSFMLIKEGNNGRGLLLPGVTNLRTFWAGGLPNINVISKALCLGQIHHVCRLPVSLEDVLPGNWSCFSLSFIFVWKSKEYRHQEAQCYQRQNPPTNCYFAAGGSLDDRGHTALARPFHEEISHFWSEISPVIGQQIS
jgi:hypothetical protein